MKFVNYHVVAFLALSCACSPKKANMPAPDKEVVQSPETRGEKSAGDFLTAGREAARAGRPADALLLLQQHSADSGGSEKTKAERRELLDQIYAEHHYVVGLEHDGPPRNESAEQAFDFLRRAFEHETTPRVRFLTNGETVRHATLVANVRRLGVQTTTTTTLTDPDAGEEVARKALIEFEMELRRPDLPTLESPYTEFSAANGADGPDRSPDELIVEVAQEFVQAAHALVGKGFIEWVESYRQKASAATDPDEKAELLSLYAILRMEDLPDSVDAELKRLRGIPSASALVRPTYPSPNPDE